MKIFLFLPALMLFGFFSLCQEEPHEFHMGESFKKDSFQTINNINLLKDDSVKNGFYNFSGVLLKDDVKYGRYGIDISRWDGKINWNNMKQDTIPDRIYFVICKATQGISLVDKTYLSNFSDSKQNGYITGAYHFFNQKEDPVKQAENYIRSVMLLKGDLLPVVDVEKNCFTDCDISPDILISKNEFIKNLKIYIEKIETHYQNKIIIYTGEAFYNSYLSEDFKDCYFWIAKYSKTPPKCFQVGQIYSPDNPCFKVSKKGCWQYSASGKVKGIDNDVDLNFIDNYYLLKWAIK